MNRKALLISLLLICAFGATVYAQEQVEVLTPLHSEGELPNKCFVLACPPDSPEWDLFVISPDELELGEALGYYRLVGGIWNFVSFVAPGEDPVAAAKMQMGAVKDSGGETSSPSQLAEMNEASGLEDAPPDDDGGGVPSLGEPISVSAPAGSLISNGYYISASGDISVEFAPPADGIHYECTFVYSGPAGNTTLVYGNVQGEIGVGVYNVTNATLFGGFAAGVMSVNISCDDESTLP